MGWKTSCILYGTNNIISGDIILKSAIEADGDKEQQTVKLLGLYANAEAEGDTVKALDGTMTGISKYRETGVITLDYQNFPSSGECTDTYYLLKVLRKRYNYLFYSDYGLRPTDPSTNTLIADSKVAKIAITGVNNEQLDPGMKAVAYPYSVAWRV